MNTTNKLQFFRGFPYPYGTSYQENGINFSVSSGQAESVTLHLFDEFGISLTETTLNPVENKTGKVWHILIKNLPRSFCYGYQIDQSPYLLLDPYARNIRSPQAWGNALRDDYNPLAALVPYEDFDWEGEIPLRHPSEDLIIYEMHVRGFTQDQTSQVTAKGTFLGIIEKIEHLKHLGVNAVELMPIFEFNENEYERKNPVTHQRLYNYWGYSTVNFFSPMNRFAVGSQIGDASREFKMMVKELHRHGIEVILDVVYNHTSEGNEIGPTHSFRGLDNPIYYLFDENGKYSNYSGCGNTLNCNHPSVRDLILSSLRYWVMEMHVDGFRFDLASILTRDEKGRPLSLPPLLEDISADPILADVKLIAEPWDAAGLYQLGLFSYLFPRWSEWNDKYRDTVRRFMIGKKVHGEFATRISGSQDVFGGKNGLPFQSINFVTSHDGFTLNDLVTYDKKHNLGNGENNLDGINNNESWNCGTEGETEEVEILKLRNRQMRNFHLAHMVSQGIPMILMGDEYAHTKRGNNNTWCQDNSLNWFQWDQLKTNHKFYEFFRFLIEFRKSHPLLKRQRFLKTSDIIWHGLKVEQPEWNKERSFIAFTLLDKVNHEDLYIAFNANPESSEVEIPTTLQNRAWYLIVDTTDEEITEGKIVQNTYEMGPFSSILLKSLITESTEDRERT